MDKFDRILALNRILKQRRTPISRADLQEKLEQCSPATVKRIIEEMRTHLRAPIKYSRELNGYYYDPADKDMYELPGLWLNSSELYALLVSHKLLTSVQPGLLDSMLDPIRERITQILKHRHLGHPEIDRRLRILQIAARDTDIENFQTITTALLDRKQLRILYHGRARDKTTERDISPQRLVYYRNNWYLDAWCHEQNNLRSFALDRIHPVYIDDKAAREIDEKTLEEHYADAYGIFAGKANKTAKLRFSSRAAKWVADEQWHPKQNGTVLPSGEYELILPYNNPTELIMDILKYGSEVEVIAPAELRREVVGHLEKALIIYTPGKRRSSNLAG